MPKSKPKKTKTPPLHEFAKDKLKLNVWSKMTEIFEAVAPADGTAGSRKILVRSCNGAGKTTALAAICNWYFLNYPDSIVLTTASSWNQVKRNLWGEIRRQARTAKLFDREIKMFETKIELSEKHFMIGISPDMPENAMGFHAPHILVAVDEATGVSREIFDALTGNLSGTNAQIVLICNPINKDSYAYEAEQSGEWTVIDISAFEHPNVTGITDDGITDDGIGNDGEGNENIPGAVTRAWIEDRAKSWSYEISQEDADTEKAVWLKWLGKWYRKTPPLQARILGEWSQLDAIGFIPLELIERYTMEEPKFQFVADPPPPSGAKIRAMGVDVSRGLGEDATVYAYFDVFDDGPDIQLKFQEYYDDDLMSTADRIQLAYNRCWLEGIELIIAIDDTGLGGGVSDKLKREGIPFFPVNFASKARGFLPGKEIANAHAEMYFVLNEELRAGKLRLYDHKKFQQELSSIQLDVVKNSTAYKMEDKELTKKRLGRSPDLADATALARYALRLKKHEKRNKFL
jgi:phage terminase large subunit